MNTLTRILFLAVAASAVAAAQPSVYSAVNSASYDRSALAQGSLFVIFGSSMGPDKLVQSSSFPLQTTLAGTSVRVVSGGTTVQCPLIYTSASQVAAILPSNTPVGQATVSVSYNGKSSIDYFGPYINIVPGSVGVYTLNSQGNGPGVFTALDGTVASFTKSAKSGDTYTLWATGVGPISGDDALPPSVRNVPGVEVFVGTQSARVLYAGASPCCAGLNQISFTIPPVTDTCFMPVLVRSSGILSNVVTLPVNSRNGACSDTGPALPSGIYTRALNGASLKVGTLDIGPVGVMARLGFGRVGYYAARLSEALGTPVSEQDAAALLRALDAKSRAGARHAMWKYRKRWAALDPKVRALLLDPPNLSQLGASAGFGISSRTGGVAALLSGLIPPVGACTLAHNFSYALTPARSRALDAGPSLALTSSTSQTTMARLQGGQYQGMLTPSMKGPNVPAGVYTIGGKGGRDIASFTVSLTVGASVVWSNKPATGTSLNPEQGLTVAWLGGSVPGHVLIGGYQNDGRAFFCNEDTAKGTFNIPGVFLSAFSPASGAVTLFMGQNPLEHPVTIPGLDLAWIIDSSSDSVQMTLK